MATFSVRASSLHQPRAYQTRRWLTAAAHTRASVEASGATSAPLHFRVGLGGRVAARAPSCGAAATRAGRPSQQRSVQRREAVLSTLSCRG